MADKLVVAGSAKKLHCRDCKSESFTLFIQKRRENPYETTHIIAKCDKCDYCIDITVSGVRRGKAAVESARV